MADRLRILITGSRDWTDWRAVAAALGWATTGWSPSSVIVVHGACPTGADQIAAQWAENFGFTVEAHPADWSQGKKGGPLRNQRMVNLGADLCLAFPLATSRGTHDCMRRAIDAGIEVRIIEEGSR